MGYIYELKCPDCNYHKSVALGCGMSAINENRIYMIFAETDISNFKLEKENEQIQSFITENKLGLCSNCKELTEVPVLSYTLKNGKENYVSRKCTICKEKVELMDLSVVYCPKCNCEMNIRKNGLWD